MAFSSATKKLLVVTLLSLGTPSIVFASYKDCVAPCPKTSCLHDGFYIGLQGGYESYRVKVSENGVLDKFDTTMNAAGWVGGVFAGYGKYFNQFYLGGEAFVNNSSAFNRDSFNDIATGVSGERRFNANASYGLAILPGIKLTESALGYVRLGYNWLNSSTTQTLGGIPGANYNISASQTRHGFAYGVGSEILLPIFCDKLSLRTEYVHINYNSSSQDVIKFAPADDQFMVGIIYHV